MALRTPEPVQVVKQRRDDALAAIVAAIPYMILLILKNMELETIEVVVDLLLEKLQQELQPVQ